MKYKKMEDSKEGGMYTFKNAELATCGFSFNISCIS